MYRVHEPCRDRPSHVRRAPGSPAPVTALHESRLQPLNLSVGLGSVARAFRARGSLLFPENKNPRPVSAPPAEGRDRVYGREKATSPSTYPSEYKKCVQPRQRAGGEGYTEGKTATLGQHWSDFGDKHVRVRIESDEP